MTVQADPAYVFERSDDEYRRLTRQAALMEPVTERLFRDAGIAPGMRILDVGSGVGDVALLAARMVGPTGSVLGVDLDGSALRTARDRAAAAGLDNLTFVEGDVRSLRTPAGFDAAVGRLVLLYLGEPAEALRAIVECVRPGGIVAFQELDLDPDVRSRSYPDGTVWDRIGHQVIETFARSGAHHRMGRQLRGCYLLAGVACGLQPLMVKLGVAPEVPFDRELLEQRIRDDAVARDAVVWGPALVGAHARRP